jgi:hypothetical protein
MTRLTWGSVGTHFYEAGVDRGVLYLDAQPGVVWTGLISVTESSSGGEAKPYYVDGVKYLNLSSAEEFEATIEAYTYPAEFGQCDGTARVRPGFFVTQQSRKPFALSYRTKIGNDQDGDDHGYKIHIIYNALAAPSQQAHDTIADSTPPTNFSWNITTKPVVISGYNRTAHVVIDSRYVHPITLGSVEDVLYGTASTAASLPTFADLVTIFDTLVDLEVVDNEDGTFTITGPDEAIVMIEATIAEITWPTVVPVDADTYTISS